MLLRPALRASAAFAAALLLSPSAPSAAPPPGLAYDEVVRIVVRATPPPPGAFQADAAAIIPPPASASRTPGPKYRPMAGIESMLTPGGVDAVAGAVAGDAAAGFAVRERIGAGLAGLVAVSRGFVPPRLLHYSYWNGWERIDDPAAQSATIRKCDLGQVIVLDLSAKTYAVVDPDAEPSPTPSPPPARARGRQSAPDAPAEGTSVATLTEVTTTIAPRRIEDYPTTGYDSTAAFAATQSTGSCRDGSASIETVQYLAALNRPAVTACPMQRAPLPTTASDLVTRAGEGCRPAFTATRSGPAPPSSRLALYALVVISGPANPASLPAGSLQPVTFGFLTERGNLKPLGPADAGLFEPPAGFTKTP